MTIAKKPKLADYVIEEIKNMLKRGELKEGSKLPNQNEFAEQLGVSRLSLREALHTLQLIGVIEQKPRTGTVIISGNPDTWLSTSLTIPLFNDYQAVSELMVARKFIELHMAKLAAGQITPQEIDKLDENIEAMRHAYENDLTDEYARLDSDFHNILAMASKNRYLINMYLSVSIPMDQFLHDAFIGVPMLLKDSFKFHTNIFNSLKKGNQQKFLLNMKAHIEYVEKTVDNFFKSRSDSK